VRVVDPAGWPWTVHRRWLPWRPRIVMRPSPSVLLLPIEWVLLIALLPFALLARLPGGRWTVAADGRRNDGMLVRYEARGRDATRMHDAAATEIRGTGAPSSLGEPIVTRVAADDVTDHHRRRLDNGGEVTVACLVQGYGTAKSRDGWIQGRHTAVPGWLSFQPDGGHAPATWPLLGSDDPHLTLAGDADRAAVGRRVIASYATPFGRFRVAVDPHLGPLLRDLLAAGAEPFMAGPDLAWTMWRRDNAGAVREIARFGSRAEAELLAENLAARGSRQQFWLAATPR
jgi:hypothetical protein